MENGCLLTRLGWKGNPSSKPCYIVWDLILLETQQSPAFCSSISFPNILELLHSSCSLFFATPSPGTTTTTLSLKDLLFLQGILTKNWRKNSPQLAICLKSLSGFVCCLCCCIISSGFVDGSCSELCFWCCWPFFSFPLQGFFEENVLKPKIWIWNPCYTLRVLMMAYKSSSGKNKLRKKKKNKVSGSSFLLLNFILWKEEWAVSCSLNPPSMLWKSEFSIAIFVRKWRRRRRRRRRCSLRLLFLRCFFRSPILFNLKLRVPVRARARPMYKLFWRKSREIDSLL